MSGLRVEDGRRAGVRPTPRGGDVRPILPPFVLPVYAIQFVCAVGCSTGVRVYAGALREPAAQEPL